MPTVAMILLLLASGRGSGVQTSPGGGQICRWMTSGIERSVSTTSAVFSKRMRFAGTITSMDWTQVTPGIDGIGGDTFTVALLVDGVSACSVVVACDAPRGDYTANCNDVSFSSGQDVDVRVTSTGCLTQPVGFPAIDGTSL